MDILRHLYLSTAVRAPDGDGAVAEPVEVVAPAGDAPQAGSDNPEPVAAGEVTEPQAQLPLEPAAGEDPAPAAAPRKAPAMVPLKVMQERLGEVSTKLERRATEAETRAANLQAIIERMQANGATPPADPSRQPAPETRQPARSDDATIEAAAQRIADEREVARTINDVVRAGVGEFTQAEWNEKTAILESVGAASAEFAMDVIAVDPVNAHKIIYALGQDVEKAASLAKTDVRRRTAELTRMSMAEQAKTAAAAAKPAGGEQPAPKPAAPISRAPAPKPSVAPRADAGEIDPMTPEGDEKLEGEAWNEWYRQKYLKRA